MVGVMVAVALGADVAVRAAVISGIAVCTRVEVRVGVGAGGKVVRLRVGRRGAAVLVGLAAMRVGCAWLQALASTARVAVRIHRNFILGLMLAIIHAVWLDIRGKYALSMHSIIGSCLEYRVPTFTATLRAASAWRRCLKLSYAINCPCLMVVWLGFAARFT
jgi:hypothetical protein